MSAPIPGAAYRLGLAGLIPFYAGVLALWMTPSLLPMSAALAAHRLELFYAAIILSFMGGVRWGLAMDREDDLGLALSTTPALIAWLALWPTGVLGIAPTAPVRYGVLMLAFLVLMIADVRASAEGDAPEWYGSLRVRLTFAVALALALTMIRLQMLGVA